MFRLMTVPFAILAFAACSKEEVACTDLAAASVGVTVINAAGVAINDATVTWDAGAGPAACESFVPGEFICGYEVAGDISIHVSAPGYGDHDEVVTVGADECHVIQEFIAVTLDSDVECTDVEVAGVSAVVVGNGGEALSDVYVEWSIPGAGVAPQACDAQGDGSWACAPEHAGDVEVTATAGGHETKSQVVTVPMDEDGCHVVTQNVSFGLDWLPD